MAHTITLSWVASTDLVDGYNVYRGTTAGTETTKVNTALVTTTTFTDPAAPEGNNFYVVTSSASGVESIHSNEVEQVILPAPPTNLVVVSHT